MPQLDLKYSNDLTIDTKKLFFEIEQAISQQDNGAGMCKCRAYPTEQFHHSHILCQISVLPKAHRNEQFMQTLLKEIKGIVKNYTPDGCYYAVELLFSSRYYITAQKDH
jgi:hypothetical protein